MPAADSTQWFYAQGDERLGPVELDWLVEQILAGPIPGRTLVWRQGLKRWAPAEEVAEIATRLPPPIPGAKGAAPAASAPVAAVADTPRIAELRERLQEGANWRAFPQLADELRKEKRLAEALAVVRAGLESHPDYRLARTTLAHVLMDSGELEAARRELTDVLDKAPENIVAGRLLGDCLERQGDAPEALRAYKAALVFAPRDPQLLGRVKALEGASAAPAAATEPGGEGPPAGGGAPEPAAGEEAPDADGETLSEDALEELPDEDDMRPIPLVPADDEFELERPGESVRVVKAKALPAQTAFDSDDPAYWPVRSLAENDFPDLIQALHERRFTGTLSLTQLGVVRTVVVQDGRLAFATSSSRDDRLGELLLRTGRITLEQYVAASRAMGQGKRLGAVLVEQGALDAGELVKVVVEHTQEVIYGVFQWTDGFYRMKEGREREESITLKMSTPDIIVEGIRRIEAWSRVERGIGGLEARYERAEGWQAEVDEMSLSPDELALVTDWEGTPSISEICQRAAILSDFDVCRLVWALRVIGVLRVVPPPPA